MHKGNIAMVNVCVACRDRATGFRIRSHPRCGNVSSLLDGPRGSCDGGFFVFAFASRGASSFADGKCHGLVLRRNTTKRCRRRPGGRATTTVMARRRSQNGSEGVVAAGVHRAAPCCCLPCSGKQRSAPWKWLKWFMGLSDLACN